MLVWLGGDGPPPRLVALAGVHRSEAACQAPPWYLLCAALPESGSRTGQQPPSLAVPAWLLPLSTLQMASLTLPRRRRVSADAGLLVTDHGNKTWRHSLRQRESAAQHLGHTREALVTPSIV